MKLAATSLPNNSLRVQELGEPWLKYMERASRVNAFGTGYSDERWGLWQSGVPVISSLK
jgi:hypothetical protein